LNRLAASLWRDDLFCTDMNDCFIVSFSMK
jgi:hypothetical protein